MVDKIDLLLNGQRYKKLKESYYSPVLKNFELTMLDARILVFFHEHESFDTASDFVKMHHLTKSNVSKSVEKLVDRHYLLVKNQEDDRRFAHLTVCETAMPIIRQIAEKRKEMYRQLFFGLTEEQKKVLWEVAVLVNENAEKIISQEG